MQECPGKEPGSLLYPAGWKVPVKSHLHGRVCRTNLAYWKVLADETGAISGRMSQSLRMAQVVGGCSVTGCADHCRVFLPSTPAWMLCNSSVISPALQKTSSSTCCKSGTWKGCWAASGTQAVPPQRASLIGPSKQLKHGELGMCAWRHS